MEEVCARNILELIASSSSKAFIACVANILIPREQNLGRAKEFFRIRATRKKSKKQEQKKKEGGGVGEGKGRNT